MSPLKTEPTPDQQDEIARAMFSETEIKISVVLSPDEPELFSSESQAEIANVGSAFRDEGIEAHATSVGFYIGGGGYFGDFIIQAAQIGVPAIAGIAGAWLHGRLGRKVKVEFYADGKPKRIEAQTTEQVNSLIETARREALKSAKNPAKKPSK